MKTKIFSMIVALAFIFSACDREPSENWDEIVNIKGYVKLNPEDGGNGDEIAFKWNSITASDFAQFPTPPFNNFQKILGTGITVFRSKTELALPIANFYLGNVTQGNGNDPVYLWFDKLAEGDEDGIFYLAVRYRASNNVIFAFNVEACAKWCAKNGPISLQWKDFTEFNLGDIVQVRVGKFEAIPVEPLCVEVTVLLPQGNEVIELCSDNNDCPLLTQPMIEDYINPGKGQSFVGWVYADGKPFTFADGSAAVCENITIKPVYEEDLDDYDGYKVTGTCQNSGPIVCDFTKLKEMCVTIAYVKGAETVETLEPLQIKIAWDLFNIAEPFTFSADVAEVTTAQKPMLQPYPGSVFPLSNAGLEANPFIATLSNGDVVKIWYSSEIAHYYPAISYRYTVFFELMK